MAKLRMVFTKNDYDGDSVEFFLDEEYLGDGGYGGEPEDNTRGRDYSWVEDILEKVALRLGAEVEKIEKEDEE